MPSRINKKKVFPLPFPDCDVHRVITVYGPIHTIAIKKKLKLPYALVYRICSRLERLKIISSKIYRLEHIERRGNKFRKSIVWKIK